MSIQLLPYQQRWIQDTACVKVCEKARRIGLSWSEAACATLEAARHDGQSTWYIGYNKAMAEQFLRDCLTWAQHYQIAAEPVQEQVLSGTCVADSVRFASGARISALSGRASNLRGKQGRVVIDEAAFHDDLPGLLKAALGLLIWGGSVAIISTHHGAHNPFNQLIQDIRTGKKNYSLHRITFDQAVSEGLARRVFANQGQRWSVPAQKQWCAQIRHHYHPNDAEELDVLPNDQSGAYLPRALIESRMGEAGYIARYSCPEGFEKRSERLRNATIKTWLEATLAVQLASQLESHAGDDMTHSATHLGVDFGRQGDLTVLVVFVTQGDAKRVCPLIVELRNMPFRQQEQVVFWLIDHLTGFAGAAFDARGNGQYLAEVAMQRYGKARIAQVMLTQKWYREYLPKLKAALSDGRLARLPRDRDLLNDLQMILIEQGMLRIAEQRSKGADGGQRHGDAAVAVALAWFASERMA